MASSGQKYAADPYNAGYDQNDHNQQQPNPYNAGYTQPPPAYGQQGYPMPQMQQPSNQTNVIVSNTAAPVFVAMPRRGYDWLVPAILSCIFCFWPTGICAIIAAVNARSNFDNGDYEGGRSSANWARGLTIASMVVGVVCIVLIIILYAAVFNVTNDIVNDLNNDLSGRTTLSWNWNK